MWTAATLTGRPPASTPGSPSQIPATTAFPLPMRWARRLLSPISGPFCSGIPAPGKCMCASLPRRSFIHAIMEQTLIPKRAWWPASTRFRKSAGRSAPTLWAIFPLNSYTALRARMDFAAPALTENIRQRFPEIQGKTGSRPGYRSLQNKSVGYRSLQNKFLDIFLLMMHTII